MFAQAVNSGGFLVTASQTPPDSPLCSPTGFVVSSGEADVKDRSQQITKSMPYLSSSSSSSRHGPLSQDTGFVQNFNAQTLLFPTPNVAVPTHYFTSQPFYYMQLPQTQLMQLMEPSRPQQAIVSVNSLQHLQHVNPLPLTVQTLPGGFTPLTPSMQNLPLPRGSLSSSSNSNNIHTPLLSPQEQFLHGQAITKQHEQHCQAVVQDESEDPARSQEVNSEMKSRKRKVSDASSEHSEEDSSRNKTVKKRRKPVSATSKYRGVSWHRRDQRWIARAWINGKICSVGSFKSEVEAAQAVEARYIKEYGIDGASDLQKIVPEEWTPYIENNPPRSINEAMLALKAIEPALLSTRKVV